MSRARYAAITSNLLVRKGEAKPWSMAGVLDFARDHLDIDTRAEPVRQWDEERHQVAPVRRAGTSDGGNGVSEEPSKRCTLKLSPGEYERLGIIAVKKEVSRQQILRQAIEHYLATVAHEYQTACGCLGGDCRGDC